MDTNLSVNPYSFMIYLRKELNMANTYFKNSANIKKQISQDTIDSLRRPTFSLFNDDDITDYIYGYCKRLLTYAKNRHDSDEMAYALNLSTLDFIGSAFGNSRTVDVTPLIRLMIDINYIFIVIHNHPNNSPFSPKDLETFFGTSNIVILIVLGNQGTIYVIEKHSNISNENYKDIKKLIIKYRQGIISFDEIMTKLSDYNIVYNKF